MATVSPQTDDDVEIQTRSVSASSLTSYTPLAIASPEFRWGSELAEGALEQQYAQSVLPRLRRRVVAVCLAAIVIMASAAVHMSMERGSFAAPMLAFAAVLAACGLELAAVALSRSTLMLESVHVGLACAVITLGVAAFALNPERQAIALARLFHRLELVHALAVVAVPVRARLCAVVTTAVLATSTGLYAAYKASAAGAFELGYLEEIFGHHVVFTLMMHSINTFLGRSARTGWHYALAADGENKARHERAQKEREAELALHTAEAAQRARSRVIRMVMHDLRSPLLAISNVASLFGEQLLRPGSGERADEPIVQEGISTLTVCSRIMQSVLSDMLDLERVTSGRLELVMRPFAIGQLVEMVGLSHRAHAAAKGVTLRIFPLPDALAGAVFEGDVDRLHQCVSNGVSNAIKFTDSGGSIALRAWLEDDAAREREPDAAAGDAPQPSRARVILSVSDTGVGMSEADLARANGEEPFSSVRRGQLQGSGGTGLSLVITRAVLAQHDSSLTLRSAGPGRGSTFLAKLRLRRLSAEPDTAHWGHALAAVEPGGELARTQPPLHERQPHPSLDFAAKAERGVTAGLPLPRPEPRLSGSSDLALVAAETSARLARARGSSSPATVPSSISGHVRRPRSSKPDFSPAFRVLHVEVRARALLPAPSARSGGAARRQSSSGRWAHPHRWRCGPARARARPCRTQDDALLRRTIELKIFKKLGVAYVAADNGQQALDAILTRGEHFSLVLVDNQMPVCTGTEATRALREAGYAGDIIGLTGARRARARMRVPASAVDACARARNSF